LDFLHGYLKTIAIVYALLLNLFWTYFKLDYTLCTGCTLRCSCFIFKKHCKWRVSWVFCKIWGNKIINL